MPGLARVMLQCEVIGLLKAESQAGYLGATWGYLVVTWSLLGATWELLEVTGKLLGWYLDYNRCM